LSAAIWSLNTDQDNERLRGLELQVTRLEEKLKAAEKALDLAQSSTHVIIAETLAVLAILASLYSVLKH
jgi:hypothetical protein